MAKPIARRGTVLMDAPQAQDTYRVPQRDTFWTPFKGMNTTLPKNLLQRDTLQWADNVTSWYGSAMTRVGVRNVGDMSVGPLSSYIGDSFTAEGSPTALPAHTPTGSGIPFNWVESFFPSWAASFETDSAHPTHPDSIMLPAVADWGNTILAAADTSDVSPSSPDYRVTADIGFTSVMSREVSLGLVARSAFDGMFGYRVEIRTAYEAGYGVQVLLDEDDLTVAGQQTDILLRNWVDGGTDDIVPGLGLASIADSYVTAGGTGLGASAVNRVSYQDILAAKGKWTLEGDFSFATNLPPAGNPTYMVLTMLFGQGFHLGEGRLEVKLQNTGEVELREYDPDGTAPLWSTPGHNYSQVQTATPVIGLTGNFALRVTRDSALVEALVDGVVVASFTSTYLTAQLVTPSVSNRMDMCWASNAKDGANVSYLTHVRVYYTNVYADTANPTIELSAVDDSGVATVLDSLVIPLTTDQTHVLALECVGSLIRVLLDHVEVLSATDTTYDTAEQAGVWGSKDADGGMGAAWMDNWRVEMIDSSVRDIITIAEFTTSDGVSYLLRMGLFGVEYFNETEWVPVSGYTPPATMTVFDKFATTAFGDKLIFSDGISGMYEYDPVNGTISQIEGAPSALHLTSFASRIVASAVRDAGGVFYSSRIQWSVKNNSNDWTGIGSGFEDLLSTPGGAIDEQMGVFPLDDFKSLAVRSNSIWVMTASGNIEAPFVFERRFPGIGSKQRHSIVAVPGGIVGLMNDLSVQFITDSSIEVIGDAIRDARYSRNGSRLSRDSNFGDLLAVGAYSGKQRKYVIAFSTRTAPVAATTGGFTAVMYQYDMTDKSWVRLAWPDTAIHWVIFAAGTKVGLTIDSSPGTIEDAGTASIESEVADIALGQRDVLVAATAHTVYREDYTLYHDETSAFGTNPISQSLVSGQLTAATPVNRVELSGFRLIYMSSVTGDLTLRIHIWDSGAEQTVDMVLPIQKSMDSNDEVIQGSRMAYAPIRAEGYNIEFELINNLSGRVIVMAVAPEIKGTPDIVAGYGTTAMP